MTPDIDITETLEYKLANVLTPERSTEAAKRRADAAVTAAHSLTAMGYARRLDIYFSTSIHPRTIEDWQLLMRSFEGHTALKLSIERHMIDPTLFITRIYLTGDDVTKRNVTLFDSLRRSD